MLHISLTKHGTLPRRSYQDDMNDCEMWMWMLGFGCGIVKCECECLEEAIKKKLGYQTESQVMMGFGFQILDKNFCIFFQLGACSNNINKVLRDIIKSYT